MRTCHTAHRRRPRRAGGAIIAAALAVPALGAGASVSASAATPPATIHVDKACYVRTGAAAPRMRMLGSGFTPGDQVTVTDSTGTLDATTTVTATGAVAAGFAGPSIILKAPGQMRDTITATDRTATGSEIVARTTTHVSILGAGHGSTRSERGLRALRGRTSWVFSGWPLHRAIYVHYLYRHRQVARQSFGRPSAPCGVLHTRRALYPATPHHASYATQIDNVARYSSRTRPRFTLLHVGLQLEF